MKRTFYSRNREARKKNRDIMRRFYKARKTNPGLSVEQFLESAGLAFDEEGFKNSRKPINPQAYRSNAEYEASDWLRGDDYEQQVLGRRGIGTTIKDMHKLWRLLDQTTWDMRVGFFHVQTEQLVTNENTGDQHLEWSRRVENAMNEVMDDVDVFGIDGQRTVFRMVRLYATMAIDRQGKMFNENRGEWSLTEDEFIDICNCMHRSILKYGHPFVAPAYLAGKSARKSLRGTDMFPSGVIPRVVAEAITGPNSLVRYVDGPNRGKPMTAEGLITAARKEWAEHTQPMIEANLTEKNSSKEHNLVAQKIAIYNAMQAFARLDGVDADTFGGIYNIETAQHYKLYEYEDSLIQYATAANGADCDSDAVAERQRQKIKENQAKKAKTKSKEINEFEASCNLVSSGIKANALWWSIPIRISAIAERGVGNLQTHLTIAALKKVYKNPEKYKVPDNVAEAFATKEGYAAIDAAYMLLEIGGPVSLLEFAETGRPMNKDEVWKYLHDEVLKSPKSERAKKIQELDMKLNQFSKKVLSGGEAFKKSSVLNFLNALMVSNQALADTQSKLSSKDDYGGLALTSDEMLDIFLAHNGNLESFLSEICRTPACRDALIMMNGNNIAQFNVVSYKVNKTLRDHGVGNAAITAFLDSFPGYGVNFLMAMIPGCKTFTYLSLKQAERKGDITAADFAVGGGLGPRGLRFTDDPGFINGLKMNLMFDAITLGKWSLIGILVGGVLSALGFEPPDDPLDIANVSKWKIGKNIGWGPDTDGDGMGDGIEIQLAFWLNDLTQFGLPLAYLTAAVVGGYDQKTCGDLFLDSLYDQFDGNVVLDVIDCVKNWGDDVVDIDKAMKDPTHEMAPSPMFALSELGLRAFGKIVPAAPLYRAWGTSAALRGPNARMYTTNKVYDKSSDWAKEVGKTDYEEDPMQRLIRKYSAGNWLLAGIMDMTTMGIPEGLASFFGSENNTDKTGYAWWEMPVRTKTEPYALVLADTFKMDYDNLPEGSTYESYRAQRTDDLKNFIEGKYSDPEEAIRDGFFIPGDIREAAIDTCFSELNMLENEFEAQCDLKFETKQEYYDAKEIYDDRRNEIWNFINKWLKNDDIPTWTEGYEQILSDWDKTYLDKDGNPIPGGVWVNAPDTTIKWSLKGNAPTSFLPWTTVQYESNDIVKRGWSGETKPSWETESSQHKLVDELENEVIKIGRDEGSTVGDVYKGEEYDGERLHPDDLTIGERAWVPVEHKLPESLRGINQDTASGGIYGDKGKRNASSAESKPWKNDYGPDDELPWKTDYNPYYPSYTYGYGGSSNQGDYNPRIYSNPRSVNTSRPSTMYTKTPYSAKTSYLNPSFSTKGSREAYKRQDL